MKLEALTVGVLQGAFNNFSKFTVKHLSLFNKVAGLMMCNFVKKKNSDTEVFFKFTKIFEKIYFVARTCSNVKWEKWTKKIIFTKSFYQKTPVMVSFLGFITDTFLWKLRSFAEQCCATAFDLLWHFQRITWFISDKSVQS